MTIIFYILTIVGGGAQFDWKWLSLAVVFDLMGPFVVKHIGRIF